MLGANITATTVMHNKQELKENSMKRDRNWIIIITSIIYILIIIITLFYAFTGNLSEAVGEEIPQWYGYYIYITSLIYIVGFVFILKMKKWALIILSSITMILYLSTYFVGIFSMQSLITDIVIFGTLWTQHKKMR
jgi:uncharacterized membrane protein